MSEGEGVGAVVGRVSAADADSGTFGQVVYSLAGPGANRSAARMDSCGIVLLSHMILFSD